MPVTVTRTYKFSSGHFLPEVPDGHKCKNQHGHNYRLELHIGRSELLRGMVIDFFDLDAIVNPIIGELDHKNINDTIANPTAENIAIWFQEKLTFALPAKIRLDAVRLWEEDDCSAIVY